MEYGDFQHLKIEVSDGVALITINRPEVYNATNNRLHWELTQIWGVVDRDPAVRVAVITGAGDKAFSAGGDLNDIARRTSLPSEERYESVTASMKEAHDLVYNVINCDKVVISAINGVAVGAGLAVALLADISIMAEEARLTDGHIRLGVAAGDHACIVWPLLCGMARAKYYLLTCDFIDGKECERIGLVSKAVPRVEVLSTAMDIARRLAAGPQPALRFTKRALNQWLRLVGLASFDYSLAVEMLGFFSPDVSEGVAALREKRTPTYPTAR
ncbi:MAG: enoyl-CoA hydratase/isomerase family protein [Chloroflexi bacterium]|nr:enoyl-CoA hydratase/isomerase family protein [Chloroflexota bacterium]